MNQIYTGYLLDSNEARNIIDSFNIECLDAYKSHKQLVAIYIKLGELISENKLSVYNKLLENIDIENVHEVLIIGLLRFSFIKRAEISVWNNFLEKAKKELYKRKYDYNKLLSGVL